MADNKAEANDKASITINGKKTKPYDPNVIRAKCTTSPISTLAKMGDLNL